MQLGLGQDDEDDYGDEQDFEAEGQKARSPFGKEQKDQGANGGERQRASSRRV